MFTVNGDEFFEPEDIEPTEYDGPWIVQRCETVVYSNGEIVTRDTFQSSHIPRWFNRLSFSKKQRKLLHLLYGHRRILLKIALKKLEYKPTQGETLLRLLSRTQERIDSNYRIIRKSIEIKPVTEGGDTFLIWNEPTVSASDL